MQQQVILDFAESPLNRKTVIRRTHPPTAPSSTSSCYLWCFSPHSTHLHCSASVSSCSCPRPAYSSPPAFFLNPSLSPSLKALLFSCEDLDSSGDSGFVVRKMATFSFRTKFSARMLTYTIEEPGRSSVFSMWITEHILFPVKRVRVARYENECVWMLHLQSHNDYECVSIASDLLAKGRV